LVSIKGHYFRENNDLEVDEETVHAVKKIHLPENSGSFVQSNGQMTDFAHVELRRSVNRCSAEETRAGKCWTISPVELPKSDIIIKPRQRVRTLGKVLLQSVSVLRLIQVGELMVSSPRSQSFFTSLTLLSTALIVLMPLRLMLVMMVLILVVETAVVLY